MKILIFWCKEENEFFFNRIFFLKIEVLVWVFNAKKQVCTAGQKKSFNIKKNQYNYHFLDFLDYQDYIAWNKVENLFE